MLLLQNPNRRRPGISMPSAKMFKNGPNAAGTNFFRIFTAHNKTT